MTFQLTSRGASWKTGPPSFASSQARWRGLDLSTRVLLILNVGLVGIAVGGPLIWRSDPSTPDLGRLFQAPAWAGGHGGAFGTDQLGRSVFVEILYGMRTSYLVGAGAVIIAAIIGMTLGMYAGYRGGLSDSLIMRSVDVAMSLPSLMLALVVVAVAGGSRTTVTIILGLSGWMLYARVARSSAVRLRQGEIVDAHRALGCSDWRVVLRHIAPNSLTPLVAVTGFQFSAFMLGEATLSFLGLGIQPPVISLGSMLAGGEDYLQTQWWISLFPGVALCLMVASALLLAARMQEGWASVGRSDWTLK